MSRRRWRFPTAAHPIIDTTTPAKAMPVKECALTDDGDFKKPAPDPGAGFLLE